ncbi:MAG: tetratricopeptide repeat protein [Polyangiales bacterium]
MSRAPGDVAAMGGNVDKLVESGRVPDLLCHLARAGFTGLVYIEREDDEGGAVLSMRSGQVVFVEDLGEAESIPDSLLERGLITKEQYVEIASLVVDSLAENEDLAFCEQAVQLAILTQAQVEAELDRRIRGRVIQSVGWRKCRIELDADPDSLAGISEYPREIGPLVYVGVRTFFDEERTQEVLGDGVRYARLTRPTAEASELFTLDPQEAELLARLRPDRPLAELLEQGDSDPLEVLQLLCLLAMADMLELGNAPLSAERSGVRSTRSMVGRHSMLGGVREERVSHGDEKPARPSAARPAGTTTQQRMPAVSAQTGAQRPGGEHTARRRSSSSSYSSSSTQAIRGEQIERPAAARSASARGAAQPPHATSISSPAVPAQPQAQPAAPAPASHERRRRPRGKLGATLQRLGRELQSLKQVAPPPPEASAAAQPSAQAQSKTHLEQLRRMRAAALTRRAATPQNVAAPGAGADSHFRAAQEALRHQQFSRAHELMKKACEAAPQDERYALYYAWAGFRAGALDDDGISKLRLTLREKISDDQLKGFAYYALGHIAVHEKKDDAAEKFFRKAVELDKNNKDAQRHLRIIELRQKTAAAEEKTGKIFGIEIKKRAQKA